MPVHDWTCVEPGVFHDFHASWITHIKEALNDGVLPIGYYALAEQRANEVVPDVVTLHASAKHNPGRPNGAGALAVLDAPPKVSRRLVGFLRPPKRYAQRHVAIRHKSKHRVVALIEIVSPVNKDRPASVRAFSQKIRTALELDVNVLVADLFPPGRHDSRGMHGAIWKRLGADRESPESDRPMCMMSYVAARPPIAYLEWRGAGAPLPKMPLFLDPKNYVNVPLEPTYQMAYRGVPEYWRHVIEQHAKS